MKRLGLGIGPHLLTVADQAASGLTNLLFVFAVAQGMEPDDFGYFIVAYATFTGLLSITRSAIGVSISLSASSRRRTLAEARAGLSISLGFAPAVVVLTVLMPILAGDTTGRPLYALLGIGASAAICQDVLRHAAIAVRQPGRALASDAAWLAFSAVAYVTALVFEAPTMVAILLWSVGSMVAAGMLAQMTEGIARMKVALRRVQASLKARMDLAIGVAASATSALVSPVLVSRLAGPEVSGALGALSQLMAPINMLVALLTLAFLPASARRSESGSSGLFARAASVLMTLALVWGVAILLIPDWLGKSLLGDSWTAVQPLALVAGLLYGLVAVSNAAYTLLIRLEMIVAVRNLRVGQSTVRVALHAAVALLAGTAGAIAIGEAMLVGVVATVAWALARRRLSRSAHSK